MARLADEDITYIREHSDIETLIGQDVTLKRAGHNLKGLCPFHDEKSPSFHVDPNRRVFHCFGCGEGGDSIDYVQKTQHTTFVEAVTYLADRLGRTLVTVETNDSGPRVNRARLLAANTAAQQYWHSLLFTGQGSVAAQFLAARGFTADDAIAFGCGYAPPGWQTTIDHLRSLGFTDEELTTVGLAAKGERGLYDPFRGRLIFPIRNSGGDVIGFGGRLLVEEEGRKAPKYVNTTETPLYKKSSVLYGIDRALKSMREHQEAVVVEGYTDVMACHLSGVENAVATCGTAFGPEHARILRRSVTGSGRVVYVFDGDSAGQKAAVKAHELDDVFGAATYAVILPDEQDPCEVALHHGRDRLAALVTDHQPLLQIVLDAKVGTVDHTSPEAQHAAVTAAAEILNSIPSRVVRDQYARKVAFKIGVETALVRGVMADLAGGGHRTAPAEPQTLEPPIDYPEPDEDPGEPGEPSAPSSTDLQYPRPDDPWLIAERATLEVLVRHRDTVRDLWAKILDPSDYLHPVYRRLATDLDDPHPVLDVVRREIVLSPAGLGDPGDLEEIVTEAAGVFAVLARECCERTISTVGRQRAALSSDDPARADLTAQIEAAYARLDAVAALVDQVLDAPPVHTGA